MLSHAEVSSLNQFSRDMRIHIISQLKARGFGHIGGCMSIVELLSVLYNGAMKVCPSNPLSEDRDWLIVPRVMPDLLFMLLWLLKAFSLRIGSRL